MNGTCLSSPITSQVLKLRRKDDVTEFPHIWNEFDSTEECSFFKEPIKKYKNATLRKNTCKIYQLLLQKGIKLKISGLLYSGTVLY